MGLKAASMALQKVTTCNSKNVKHLSDKTFEIWSRRAVGGANPISVENIINANKPKKSELGLLEKVKFFFGLKKKITPKTFSDGSPTPKVPFLSSSQSVEVSNRYVFQNRIGANEHIVSGFRDGGRKCFFDKFGDALQANREIITVDLELDKYLQRIIEYTESSTQNMSEKEKVKFIYNLIIDIGGDAAKSELRSNKLAKAYQGKEILLGKVFEKEAACCRHKSLLFKIIADKLGLKTSLVRGNYIDMGGIGGHAWNEVILSNGKKLIYDTQNSTIIDLSKDSGIKKALQYLDLNDSTYYK